MRIVMKRQSKKILLAIPVVFAVFCVSAVVYSSGYSMPARWVCRHQISDTDSTVIRMILDNNGQGMISQSVYGPYDARLQTSHKSVTNSYVLWTRDKNPVHVYESDRVYSRQGRLLAIASMVGFGQLEVRFSQPRRTDLPAQAIFKKIKH